MMRSDTDPLHRLGIQLPPQPRVLIELQRLLGSDDFDLRQAACVIAEDPALVALLFRIAKSPAFSRGRKIESLDQVLMVVGIRQVFALVQAESLVKSLSGGLERAFETFWTRAREIAQLSALIADERRLVCRVPPEQAYLAGMFLECGVPVLMMRFPEYGKSLRRGNDAAWPDLAGEDQAIGVDHVAIGYLVTRHWGLPDSVCETVRHQQDPPEEKTLGKTAALLATVQMARHCHHRLHRSPDPSWGKLGSAVLAELGLAADEEKDYCEQVINLLLAADGEA